MRTGRPALLLHLALAISLALIATAARAGDDTARFQGTWQATVPANGQMVTVVSVHDGNGYKNALVLPTGNVPLEQGHFSAANGRYTTAGAPPNNVGTYRFINADTVICTNAAGQSATWKRVKLAPQQQVNATPPPAPIAQPAPSSRPGTFTTPPEQHNVPAAPSAQTAATYDPKLPAATNAAIAAFNRKDYKTAWTNFMAAAQQGDAEAEAGVGAMLFSPFESAGHRILCAGGKMADRLCQSGKRQGMTFLAQFYSVMV